MTDEPPPLTLRLRFTWCTAGDHTHCPETIGDAVCTCGCHLDQQAA